MLFITPRHHFGGIIRCQLQGIKKYYTLLQRKRQQFTFLPRKFVHIVAFYLLISFLFTFLFVHSLILSFNHLCIYSLNHMHVHWLLYSFIYVLIYLSVCSFHYLFMYLRVLNRYIGSFISVRSVQKIGYTSVPRNSVTDCQRVTKFLISNLR